MNPAINQLTEPEQRLCLFVSLLEEDVANEVIETFPIPKQSIIRECIQDMLQFPPAIGEIELVIDEFDRMFRLLRTVMPDEGDEDDQDVEEVDENAPPEPTEEELWQQQVEAAKAAAEKLRLIDPPRLAAALRREQPQIVAIVVKQLEDSQAGEMLSLLPNTLRSDVMLKLSEPLDPPPRLVEQLLEATIRRAIDLDPRDMVVSGPMEERMARLLRVMSRKQRMETLQKLTEEDPDLADAIQNNMFCFEDMLRLDDRSIKTLLSEIDSESLGIALKSAGPEYVELVISNLSRRAGESLAEEVEFMTLPSEEAQDAARMRVVQIFSKMDQEGSLTLKEE